MAERVAEPVATRRRRCEPEHREALRRASVRVAPYCRAMPESREVILLLKSASALRAQGQEAEADQLLDAARDLRRSPRHAGGADLEGVRQGPWRLRSVADAETAAESDPPD